jgi:hypothetical protein
LSIFTNIRKSAGRFFLRREAGRVSRNRKIMNLDEAGNIGILYFLPDEPAYRKISAYVKKLQDNGKTVKALGYVESKHLTGQFLPKLSYDFFYPSNLSWNYRPISTAVREFIACEFDILIDLSTENSLPLLFITGLSRAKFKVGMQRDASAAYLDMMISLQEKDGLEELITQIDHYITIINKKDEI